jgi:hypothetical protein
VTQNLQLTALKIPRNNLLKMGLNLFWRGAKPFEREGNAISGGQLFWDMQKKEEA